MNAYYNNNFGKNRSAFYNNHSTKGTAIKARRRYSAPANAIEAILCFIDSIISFICSARVRVIAKAVMGFVCLIGILSIIGRLELGTLSLLSGCIGLGLIILVEFLVIKQK